ncbi:hypothetical protein CVIRNUC_000654 [Coccomyxa viridis]|uniref:Uncharacterized protein n=1 Tax=Coccomyxa viridis TaxID=1274662 RepID=A0AAV1HSF9_9CHLO|nr:hypothetical protein CVIRNUC_000654 [Coccomyxa viridis]
MAPSSIRKGKGTPDDAISQRVSYLYAAARTFAASLPALAAHLGRELLKIAKDAPKSVTREPLQSLCPRCGYPWDSPDRSRHSGAKSTTLQVSSCRLCSWVRTTKMHVDKLPASMGGERMRSSRHGPGQNEGREASAAEKAMTRLRSLATSMHQHQAKALHSQPW